jgi:dihydroxyacetone kinase
MSIFAGINEAQASKGGLYFKPGIYTVDILSCTQIRTRKKEDAFLVETEVVESDSAEIKKGMRPAWMVMIRDDTSALGNIKQFIATALESTEDEVTEEVAEFVTSAKQPLKGTRMKVIAANVPTRAGGTFTKIEWEKVSTAS